jgi:hypothetical protein
LESAENFVPETWELDASISASPYTLLRIFVPGTRGWISMFPYTELVVST